MDINGTLARRLKVSARGRQVGVAGYRAWTMLAPRGPGPRIFVNSLPKSGTHLLMSLLDAVPGVCYSGRHFSFSELDRSGPRSADRLAALEAESARVRPSRYMTGHLVHRPDVAAALTDAGFVLVNVVRDPRSLVASTAAFIWSNDRHPLHPLAIERFGNRELLSQALVDGFQSDDGELRYVGVRERWEGFLPWTSEPGALTIRFEDLVGSGGGGSDDDQREAASQVLTHIGRSELDAGEVGRRAFDPRSATFRAPAVDGWRASLDADTATSTIQACHDLVAPFGYA